MKRKASFGQTMERLWLVGVHRLLNTQTIETVLIFNYP